MRRVYISEETAENGRKYKEGEDGRKVGEIDGRYFLLRRAGKTQSPEAVANLFARYGIRITPEKILASLEQPEGALNESNLDEAAGGVV